MTITRNQRNLSETSETLPPSTTLLQKGQLLKTSQRIFSRDLASEEIDFWKRFLEPFDLPETEYAFENWNRNGKYFPKPSDIRELVEAYRDARRPTYRLTEPVPGGFKQAEWMMLWKLVVDRKQKMEKLGRPYVPLTDDDISELCRQVRNPA